MKVNPKNYSSFKDHEGGEWIAITGASKYKGVIWRPVEMEMGEGDILKFQVEFISEEDAEKYGSDPNFEKHCGSVLIDILERGLGITQT